MFDAARAGDMNARIGFRFGGTDYVARIDDDGIDVRRDSAEDVDVLFVARPGQLAGVLYGGAPLETVQVKGDMELAKRFVTLFPLPPKVAQS
jgi:ubiquinone biosynthesis protein UbiJ